MGDFVGFLVRGGPAMLGLFVCSLVAIAVVVERLLFYAQQHVDANELVKQVSARIAIDDVEGARAICAQNKGLLPKILEVALERTTRSRNDVSEAVSAALRRSLPVLDRNLAIVGTLAVIAPFVGLFGTVLGIIHAFDESRSRVIRAPRSSRPASAKRWSRRRRACSSRSCRSFSSTISKRARKGSLPISWPLRKTSSKRFTFAISIGPVGASRTATVWSRPRTEIAFRDERAHRAAAAAASAEALPAARSIDQSVSLGCGVLAGAAPRARSIARTVQTRAGRETRRGDGFRFAQDQGRRAHAASAHAAPTEIDAPTGPGNQRRAQAAAQTQRREDDLQIGDRRFGCRESLRGARKRQRERRAGRHGGDARTRRGPERRARDGRPPPPTPTPPPRPACAVPSADARVVDKAEPEYPEVARASGIVGAVDVKVTLSPPGRC